MGYEVDFRLESGNPMIRIVWSTDLHLDAAGKQQYQLFFDLIATYEPDLVLIGGDICNGSSSILHLRQMAKLINKPLYFVLGNHDFYYGSIPKIRNMAQEHSKKHKGSQYLTDNGVFRLSETTALIGHDGWSDGRAGDFLNSTILLNDYFLIDELKKLNYLERLQKLNQLGDESADYFVKTLKIAFEKYERVVLLTHVPPFKEACLYEGKLCDANWAPHFVNTAAGKVLKDLMILYPTKELLILCGHTHSGTDLKILPNLRVIVGQSELGNPNVQGLIFVN